MAKRKFSTIYRAAEVADTLHYGNRKYHPLWTEDVKEAFQQLVTEMRGRELTDEQAHDLLCMADPHQWRMDATCDGVATNAYAYRMIIKNFELMLSPYTA